ncbi:3,4-dihydroxy-2-butanone 4-phosphate synthase [Liquorilactobacillus sucicola DSM 21376 = JCM 15457]|nr:3,4-dihydroxy-2-butanone 4-phosphate synthase [Liquorilactobacillus sucicola DSM 21376 = JCM 15457]
MNNRLVKKAINDLKKGKLILVVDDQEREAEGDFVGLAEFATGATLNMMVTHGRGLVCAPMARNVAEHLELDLMTAHNTESFKTAFTISVDHKTTSTGISHLTEPRLSKLYAIPRLKQQILSTRGIFSR